MNFHSVRITLLLFVLTFFSCKKDKRILDAGVQPKSDLLGNGTVEDYELSAATFKHDSVYSYGSRLKFLGSNNDPEFGRTDAGIYLNANFSQDKIEFGSQAVLVSAEIVLTTDKLSYKGDAGSQLTFSLFPLDSTLVKKRIYFASNNRLHSKTPLSTTPTLGLSDHNDLIRKVLRIPVDATYGSEILQFAAGPVSLSEFQAQFKGLYLLPSPANGGAGFIANCDLEDAVSGFYISFRRHGITDTVIETTRFTFTGDKSVKFNTYHHNHSTANAELQAQLVQGGVANASRIFVQGLGGTSVHMKIPLEKFVSDSFRLGVNRAELRLPVDPTTLATGYDPPRFLSILAVSVNGKDTVLADQYNVTDNARYNGYYDATTKAYVFNIAREAQAILNGERANRGFRLVVSDPLKTSTLFRDEYAGRVVLGGPLNTALRPTFTLVYSRIRVN